MNFTASHHSTKHPNAHAIASWQDSLDTQTALLQHAERTEIFTRGQLSKAKLLLKEYMDVNDAIRGTDEYEGAVASFTQHINELKAAWNDAVNDVTNCREHVNLFAGKLREAGSDYVPAGTAALRGYHTQSAPVSHVHRDAPYAHYKGMPAIHLTERHPESAVVTEAHMDAPYHHQFDGAGPAQGEPHIKGMPAIHMTARHPESEVVTEAHMDAPYHHQFEGPTHSHEHMKGMPAIHRTARHPESEVVTEVHMDAPYHHQFDGHRTFQGDERVRVPQDPHPFEYHPSGEPDAAALEAQEIHRQLARLDAYVAEQGSAYSTILVRGECHILKAGGAGCRQQLLYSFPTTNAADVKATVLSFLLNKEDTLEERSEKLRNRSADAIYVPDRHHH